MKLLKWQKINRIWLVVISMVSLSLWLNSKSSFAIFRYMPWLFFAQGCGVLAITNISLNFIFTTRLKVVRMLFGRLQHIYQVHMITGMCGVLFAVLHLLFFLVHSISFPNLFSFYLIPSDYWSLNFARIALCLFIFLLIATFVKKIPYHIWKRSHQFMGLAFLFAALHVLTVKSDVSQNLLLRLWLLGLISLGAISFFYTKVIYRFFGPRYRYVISQIKNLKGKAHEITLVPQGKSLRCQPAQFAFVSFLNNRIGKEIHPFTVISSGEEDALQISAKESGDHTNRLKDLQVGTPVNIWGPYGAFGEAFLRDEKDQVWIAGGIGITPFLGMMAYQKLHPMQAKKWLFYCTRTSEDASYDDYLMSETNQLDIFFHHQISTENGHLTLEKIQSLVPNMENKLFMICGPPTMRDSFIQQLSQAGIKKSNLIYEDFSFR